MNVPLVVAGSLALLGAAIHGGLGEAVVVRKLSTRQLPSSPFGGPGMTKSMIRVAWHMATIALLAVGTALVLSGAVLHGEAAQAIGVLAAGTSTAIAGVAAGVALVQFPRSVSAREHRVFLHPGPAILIAIPVLAWIGIA